MRWTKDKTVKIAHRTHKKKLPLMPKLERYSFTFSS